MLWDKFSYGSFLNELRMSNVVASFLWKFAINLNDKTKKKNHVTSTTFIIASQLLGEGGYFTIIQKIYFCAITENDQVHSEMNVCTFHKLLVWILLSLDRGIFLEIERHIWMELNVLIANLECINNAMTCKTRKGRHIWCRIMTKMTCNLRVCFMWGSF